MKSSIAKCLILICILMRNLLKNDEFQLDEILFQGRNKAYGAYALRHEADRVLTKAMFIGIAVVAAASVTPMIINSFKAESTITFSPPKATPNILKPIDEVVEVVKPVIIPPKSVDVATVNTVVPTPTDNPVKQDPPATIADRENALSGFEDKAGVPPITSFTPPVSSGPVATVPTNIAPPVTVPDNSPVTVVDVEASFNGGINAFRNKVASNFDTNSFDGSGEKLSAVVSFIVEKDGTISQIKASGKDATFNKEAERAIKGIKGKWTPAKVGSQYVRSYFKFPISMTFE